MDFRKIKQIKQVMKGKDPVKGMFSLIPENKIGEFKEFAIRFGYSPDKVDEAIKLYRHENKES